MEDIKQTMKKLVDELNEHSRRYYVEDNPTISDYEYDMLLTSCARLTPA